MLVKTGKMLVRDRGQVSVLPIFLRLRAKRGFSAGHWPVPCTGMERRGWHTQVTEIIQPLNKEEDMMKEAYAQSIECEEPCEGRLWRTVLWEGEGETPSLYSTLSRSFLSAVDTMSCSADSNVSLMGSNGCADQLTNWDGSKKQGMAAPEKKKGGGVSR